MPQPGPGCNCCCSTTPTITVGLVDDGPLSCPADFSGSSVTITRASDRWSASADLPGTGGAFPAINLPDNGGTYTVAVSTPYGDCATTVTLPACTSWATNFFRPVATAEGCQFAPLTGAKVTWRSGCGEASAVSAGGVACPNTLIAGTDNGVTATFSMPPRWADDEQAIAPNMVALFEPALIQPAPDYVCAYCNLPLCRTLTLTDPSGQATLTYADSFGHDFGGGWHTAAYGPGWVGQSAGPVGALNVPAIYYLCADPTSIGGVSNYGSLLSWQFVPAGAGNLYDATLANVDLTCPDDGGTFSMAGNFPSDWGVTIAEDCGGGAGAVFARGTGPDPSAAGWTGYSAYLAIGPAEITVTLTVASSGGTTVLGALTASGGPGDWYNLQLAPAGSTIPVQVQRRSDGQYLQPSGDWSAAAGNCLSATDASVSGSGYMGVKLSSSGTQLLESDNFLIALGAFSGAVSETWDEVTAPALPSTGFAYTGSLVTDGHAPLVPISPRNVLEAPLGHWGYAAYDLVDESAGNVTVSAWFGVGASSYYYYAGGSVGLPSTVAVTFDGSTTWGSYAGQTITLSYDAALGDYPSLCLATVTDGGHCDPSGSTEGLLTITLSQTSPGVVSATAQWTGGTVGSGCADGGCEYYGTASRAGITEGGAAGVMTFASMAYSAGGSGSFTPGATYTQTWDGVTAPATPSDWTAVGSPNTLATSSTPPMAPVSSPNVLAGGGILVYKSAQAADVQVSAAIACHDVSVGASIQLAARALYGDKNLFETAYSLSVDLLDTNKFVLLTVSIGDMEYTLGYITISSVANDTWYTLKLVCSGTTISACFQRDSDGSWLNTSGDWQPGEVACITAVDTRISAGGYVGFLTDSGGYVDNVSISSFASISLSVPT